MAEQSFINTDVANNNDPAVETSFEPPPPSPPSNQEKLNQILDLLGVECPRTDKLTESSMDNFLTAVKTAVVKLVDPNKNFEEVDENFQLGN